MTTRFSVGELLAASGLRIASATSESRCGTGKEAKKGDGGMRGMQDLKAKVALGDEGGSREVEETRPSLERHKSIGALLAQTALQLSSPRR